MTLHVSLYGHTWKINGLLSKLDYIRLLTEIEKFYILSLNGTNLM